jgi:signal transduction histidine kinase
MNIYNLKRRWKFWLALSAVVIVTATLIYTNYLVRRIAKEERKKVELWAEAVVNRAKLVNKTDNIFKLFEAEDRKSINLWGQANKFIAEYEGDCDIGFPSRIITNNTTIPLIIVNDQDKITFFNNFPGIKDNDTVYLRQKLAEFKAQNPPIDVSYNLLGVTVKQYLYYGNSYIYSELKSAIDDLVQSFISETVINSASLPVIITNAAQDTVIAAGNIEQLGLGPGYDQAELIRVMKESNGIEVELYKGTRNFIFYQNSYIVSLLKYFPFIFLALIAGFLLVAYLLFSTARRSEQNQVWVGMSKETAHQLGTPLTSLLGWLELLKAKGVEGEAIEEIGKDIHRLQVVTERFSKIGSTPELKPENLHDVLSAIIDYMRKRTTSKIVYEFDYDLPEKITVPMNRPLFEWVLENLFRNAIDAISGNGIITIEVSQHGRYYAIDVTDTGKGVPRNQFKTIFRPGFTTKKRGWGLGLSLTRRIVNEYHSGKIFVKWSEPGKGTTIRILLNQ